MMAAFVGFMIGDPPGSDSLDVVLCASGDGVLVEVEAPVEVVCFWWVVSREEMGI
jgi:hypothetical protein